MRIKKLAGGGLPAFVSYTNVEQALPAYAGIGSSSASAESTSSSKSSSSKSGSSSDIGLLNKEMQKILMENGLPSDVQYFLKKADIFGSSVDPLDPHSQERIYTKLLSMLPEIKQNKAEYDDAIKHAREKGTLDQVAVTKDGYIYVLNKETGQLDRKAPGIELDPSKFEKLTNGQLLQMRAYSLGHAMDKGDFTTLVASSISFADITKSIADQINKLGKSTTSSEHYVRKDSKATQAMAGYEKLIEQGEDGVYKITEKQVTQDPQVKAFLSYLSRSLSRQERGVLANRAAESGLFGEEGIQQILAGLIQGNISDERDVKVDFDNQATKGATDASGNKLGQIKVTGLYAYQTGQGGQEEKISLVPGSSTSMQVTGKFYGQPVGADNKPMQASSLLQFFNNGIGSIGDVRNGVYFGNQRIDPSKYDEVMYDGTQLSRAWLPYTIDSNGTIHPDFSLLQKWESVQDQLKNVDSEEARIQILRQNGFEEYINPDGSWNRQKCMPFLITAAYASGHTGFFGGKSGVIDEGLLEMDDEKYIIPVKDSKMLQNKMIGILSSKDHPVSIQDNVYKSTVFIPILNATDNAMIASGQNPVVSQSQNRFGIDDIRYIDEMKKTSNFVSANSSKLQDV